VINDVQVIDIVRHAYNLELANYANKWGVRGAKCY
jgi:hypothetical protein